MKKQLLEVTGNKKLAENIWEIKFSGVDLKMRAGQFVELSVFDCFLRRPMSVCDCDEHSLTVLYKTVGKGTFKMTSLKAGDSVDALTHLGNGFDLSDASAPLLIGGGIGVAPLYLTAKGFAKINVRPTLVIGCKTVSELYYLDEFNALANLIITTDDGSAGIKGNALLAVDNVEFDRYFACGPQVMLKALQQKSRRGQLSLEARMGCGFGACMGCSIKTVDGAKRVCKEGPVFDADKVIFD